MRVPLYKEEELITPLAPMRGVGSYPSGATVGRAQPISPGIRIHSLVDCFGLGAHVCAVVAFLVVQLIRIGRIDGNQPGIPGSMMGTDRVRPHHLIGVDWAQNQSR